MRPTRRTQPYRKGARAPGPALSAMKRGATAHGQNPADVRRATFTKRRKGLAALVSARGRKVRR